MLRPQVLSWGNFVPEQSVAPQKATILLGLLHQAEIPLVGNTAVDTSGICWGLWCPLKLMGTQGVLKCWKCCILQKLHSRSVMWETHLWLVERWEFKDGFPGCIKKKPARQEPYKRIRLFFTQISAITQGMKIPSLFVMEVQNMPSIVIQAVPLGRSFLFLWKYSDSPWWIILPKSPRIFTASNSIFCNCTPKTQTSENQQITEINHTHMLFIQTTLILLILNYTIGRREHLPIV